MYAVSVSASLLWWLAKIPLCRLPYDVRRTVRNKSATNPWRPRWFVRHVAEFQCHVADVADFPVSWNFCRHGEVRETSPFLPVASRVVSCPFPNSIRTTQTGLLPTSYGNFSNHLDVSWWFEAPKLPLDFPLTWSMSATSPWQVADFLETSSSHMPRGSFGEVGVIEFGLYVWNQWRI